MENDYLGLGLTNAARSYASRLDVAKRAVLQNDQETAIDVIWGLLLKPDLPKLFEAWCYLLLAMTGEEGAYDCAVEAERLHGEMARALPHVLEYQEDWQIAKDTLTELAERHEVELKKNSAALDREEEEFNAYLIEQDEREATTPAILDHSAARKQQTKLAREAAEKLDKINWAIAKHRQEQAKEKGKGMAYPVLVGSGKTDVPQSMETESNASTMYSLNQPAIVVGQTDAYAMVKDSGGYTNKTDQDVDVQSATGLLPIPHRGRGVRSTTIGSSHSSTEATVLDEENDIGRASPRSLDVRSTYKTAQESRVPDPTTIQQQSSGTGAKLSKGSK